MDLRLERVFTSLSRGVLTQSILEISMFPRPECNMSVVDTDNTTSNRNSSLMIFTEFHNAAAFHRDGRPSC